MKNSLVTKYRYQYYLYMCRRVGVGLIKNVGLNVCLVYALLSNFDIGPHIFFCLVLIPAICKTFSFSPSVKS